MKSLRNCTHQSASSRHFFVTNQSSFPKQNLFLDVCENKAQYSSNCVTWEQIAWWWDDCWESASGSIWKWKKYTNGNFSLRICDQPAVSDNPHVVHHVIYSHRYGYMVICDADFFGWYSKYDTLRVFNIALENDPPYRWFMMIYLLVFDKMFSIAMLNNQRVYVQPIFGKMGKSCVGQRIVCGLSNLWNILKVNG